MNDENELLEPLATEAGQQAIARAINNLSSLEYAVRAERAATTAIQKADEASNSAEDASDYATEARNWATKTDGYVDQETITIPPEQEGDDPTTETIDLYSARYYAALAQDIYNNLSFDIEPTENSTALISSGAIYTALSGKADKSTTYTKTEVDTQISTAVSNLVNSAPSTLDTLEELANALGDDPNFATTIATQLGNKADKSDTYTKTEVDTALSNVQSTLTFDNVPTANSDNPVKSSGIKTALDGKQDSLTFDSTPTANSTNPVTSGGVYTALRNVNIDIDDEITEDSDNPVTSAAIYEALQNFTPSGGGDTYNGDVFVSGIYIDTNNLIQNIYNRESSWDSTAGIKVEYTATQDCFVCGYLANGTGGTVNKENYGVNVYINDVFIQNITHSSSGHSVAAPINLPLKKGDVFKVRMLDSSIKGYLNVFGIKHGDVVSEQMYSNVLYFNDTGVQSGTVLLSDNWDNYDFLVWDCSYKLDAYSSNQTHTNLLTSVEEAKNKNNLFLSDFSNRAINVTFSLNNTKELAISNNGDSSLYKIIGYKLAKGGYSGIVSDARMTVKSGTAILPQLNSKQISTHTITFDSPMPDINYQVVLSRGLMVNGSSGVHSHVDNTSKTVNGFDIKIWCDGGSVSSGMEINWIAIRPNSYTREGMVEDVLFSNASGVNSGTINLSGNISDYDLIDIQLYNSSIGYNNSILSSNNFINLDNGVKLSLYDNYAMTISYGSDSSINIAHHNSNSPYITKITGIKFGRYVSGVAVDTTVTSGSSNVVTSGAVYTALQNAGGGGSSVTVDSSITQNSTNPVQGGAIYTALSGKADTSTTLSGYGITDAYTKTEVDTALSSKGDVTTNTDQNITGTKTFVGSKKVGFKQSAANDKLGFTLFGNTGTERGYLEFNPTNTVDGVAGLMTLGNYATSAASLTQVGFRRYSNISGASGAYNLLMPMVADARTPFSLTTSYQNFYLPLGFTDGTTTVRTAKSGVVDLSPLLASLEARIQALEGN